MKYLVQNLARRPIALHCNSGKTLHLPPAFKLEIPQEEIQGNAQIDRLRKEKLLKSEEIKEKAVTKKATSKKKAASKNSSGD